MPPDEEKPTFTQEDLSHISSGEGAGAAAGDKGSGAGDAGAAGKDGSGKVAAGAGAEAQKAGDGKAADGKGAEGAAAEAAGKDGKAAAAADAKAEGERGLLDDDGDEADAAVKDGKEATGADKGKDNAAAPAWSDKREAIAKAAEAKWLGKAKTDEEKKEIPAQVERLKKQLARYGTEEAAILAGMEAQEKLRAGQKKEKPGKDATAGEIAEYREAAGLPKAAEDISIPRVEITTADGRREAIQWTEEHKPLHDAFRAVAFRHDLTQAQVDAVVGFQVEAEQEAARKKAERIAALDKADKKEAREVLREEFGEEFQPRLTVVDRLLKDDERLPGGAGKLLWSARDPETGTRVIHHPTILKLLSDLAVGGSAAFAPYGEGAVLTGDAKASIADEEEKILTIMKTDFARYEREGWDKKLMAVRERKGGRKAA